MSDSEPKAVRVRLDMAGLSDEDKLIVAQMTAAIGCTIARVAFGDAATSPDECRRRLGLAKYALALSITADAEGLEAAHE